MHVFYSYLQFAIFLKYSFLSLLSKLTVHMKLNVELTYFHSECRLGRRSHDHKLRQRKRHRFYEAFYEPWHRHSVQVAQKHAGPAVLIYESTCRRHLALCSSCLRFG